MNKTDIYLGGKEVKVHRISGRGTKPFSYPLWETLRAAQNGSSNQEHLWKTTRTI